MIDLTDKFQDLDTKLFALLRSLNNEEWNKQTIAKLWKVKDVVAHLLDGNIRTLSGLRDNYKGEPPVINSYQDLLDFLNAMNAEWVTSMKRVSPKMLIDLLEHTGPKFCKYYGSLDLLEKAEYSVAWAGENESKNWMHIAREYTEKFLHQQQIRDAVGKQGLMTKRYFYPFLEVCMFALPYTLRDTKAEIDDTIKMEITGKAGGIWYVQYNGKSWKIIDSLSENLPITEISIDQDSSWKLFSKSLRPSDLTDKIKIIGNQKIGNEAISLVSFMV
ncbi:mycothiol maleylpyruvate isomerase-like protein [Aquimarina sp. MAR_2010_214]|uniref:maleylpyruvate isomerase N-terminal domain-containing protein n=1 Tax=Aquimarina sp. MAR_2010_214 TaxID=1250026 RepID=UPI000C70BB91|nr:maleylpyruvate isomerase N-terminal domain-containing protein [Aquimarina sp. MAR_2010_214]PKV50912.1 mycothiol maleylpyruvate isomerase-like protein [Aquimarina sp. MAR_2010_214]